MEPGALVISLDLELLWGWRDEVTPKSYGKNIRGVRQALPRMLDMFDSYGIKATFATVGLICFDTKEEMLEGLPVIKPTYKNANLSPYGEYFSRVGPNEESDPYHFGASLVRSIQEHPNHEIACHTFSHYYCGEEGQTTDQFMADLQAAKQIAEKWGIRFSSIVFPRNQCNPDYLAICLDHGIIAYRGNEHHWLYTPKPHGEEKQWRRAIRLLDTWFNISGHNCHPFPRAGAPPPYNIPSSRFLRPWSRYLQALDHLRLKRITKAMDHAARFGKIYHLWWHPHNFGVNLDRNMAFLKRVLDHYAKLRKTHGMQSLTMAEIAHGPDDGIRKPPSYLTHPADPARAGFHTTLHNISDGIKHV